MSTKTEQLEKPGTEQAKADSVAPQADPAQTADISAANDDDGAKKTSGQKTPRNIDRILSIKVPVIVKITERTMTIERVLKLNLGSMIQFDKDAYQHIELMVNNSTIGLGQPIKIGEKFGLRITQIGDISDTIKSLGSDQE